MRANVILFYALSLFILTGSLQAGVTPPVSEGDRAAVDEEIMRLIEEIEILKAEARENSEIIREMKERIDELTGEDTGEAPRDLSDEIDDFLKGSAPEDAASSEEVVFTSPQRQLRDLNPEISILGDFLAFYTRGSTEVGIEHNDETEEGGEELEEHTHDSLNDGFELQEVELSFQAPLDPFSAAKFFVGIHKDHVEAEEAYMEWTNLPARMQLKLGKFRTSVGVLNRWHPHAYPTFDMPLALENLFGHHGLTGIGGSLTFLLPGLWSHYNELVLEVFNGDNSTAFSGDGFKKPAGVVHLKNYYDLSTATYLELGLSGVVGENDPDLGRNTYIEGIDLSVVWIPPERSKYRSLEFRTEIFFEQRETPLGRVDTFDMFSFVDFKFSRRWTTGLRFDYIQDQLDPDMKTYAVGPFLTFWQSEFVRLRVQYGGRHEEEHGWNHQGVLQATFALGPHKHEKY